MRIEGFVCLLFFFKLFFVLKNKENIKNKFGSQFFFFLF